MDLDIEESRKQCSNDEDICYGFLTMINANFTKTLDGISVKDEPLPVYEIRVEKGCGKKTEFMKNVNTGSLTKFVTLSINYPYFNLFILKTFQIIPYILVENQYATSKNKFCWNTNIMNGKMEKDTNRATGNKMN